MGGDPRQRGGPAPLRTGESNACATITILCRGVDLTHIAANADTTFAFLLDKELKNSPMLSATNSGIIGNLSVDDSTYLGKTFTLQAIVTPKRPLKL